MHKRRSRRTRRRNRVLDCTRGNSRAGGQPMNRSPPAKLAAQVVRVLVLTVPVLLVFAASVLLVALGLAWARGAPLIGRDNLLLGVICGLIIWLFLASFHVRRETLRL